MSETGRRKKSDRRGGTRGRSRPSTRGRGKRPPKEGKRRSERSEAADALREQEKQKDRERAQAERELMEKEDEESKEFHREEEERLIVVSWGAEVEQTYADSARLLTENSPARLAQIRIEFSKKKTKGALSSAIKKASAYVKKLRQLGNNATSANALIRELPSLNLARYVSECVTALAETAACGPLKAPDVHSAVRVASALNGRLAGFGIALLRQLQLQLRTLSGEESKEGSSKEKGAGGRRRVLLRFMCDLVAHGVCSRADDASTAGSAGGGVVGASAVGVFSVDDAYAFGGGGGGGGGLGEEEGEEELEGGGGGGNEDAGRMGAGVRIVGRAIRSLLDPEGELRREIGSGSKKADARLSSRPLQNLPFVSAFARHCGPHWLACTPPKHREMLRRASELGVSEDLLPRPWASVPCGVPLPVQQSLAMLAHCYFHRAANSLVREHAALLRSEKRSLHKEALTSTAGAAGQESAAAAEKSREQRRKGFDKMEAAVRTLADMLHQEMPTLKEEEETQETKEGIFLWERPGAEAEGTGEYGPWEEEEAYLFYTQLPPLRELIPSLAVRDKALSAARAAAMAAEGGGDDGADSDTAQGSGAALGSGSNGGGGGGGGPAQGDKGTLDNALAQLMGKRVVAAKQAVAAGAHSGPTPQQLQRQKDRERKKEKQRQLLERAKARAEAAAAAAAGGSGDGAAAAEATDGAIAASDGGNGGDGTGTAGVEGEAGSGGGSDAGEDGLTTHQIELLLGELPRLSGKDGVDAWCVRFCFHNSKSSRRKLVNELYAADRNKLGLLPLYSRVAAALAQVFKDVSTPLVAMLDDECRYLIRKKNQFRMESKMRNMRFIGELTKFRVCPVSTPLNCLKRCLDNFSPQTLSMACCLLETCGRFLYLTPDARAPLCSLLAIMMRLKSARHLDNNARNMVESAFYTIIPPTQPARAVKPPLPPLHAYIRHLLLSKLSPAKGDIDFVLRRLRKLPWVGEQGEELERVVCKFALKVTRGRYSALPAVASVVKGLDRRRLRVGVVVVDALLERIQRGLEVNHYSQNQRRLGEMRLLAALYSYRLLDSACLFSTLYSVLNFGHDIPPPPANAAAAAAVTGGGEGNGPAAAATASGGDETAQEQSCPVNFYPNFPASYVTGGGSGSGGGGRWGHGHHPLVPSALDEPHDLFRIHLVSAALRACGRYFLRGRNAPLLDRLLCYLQRYASFKPLLTTDASFMLEDLFDELRPGLPSPGTLSPSQAELAVAALEAKEAATAAERAASAAAAAAAAGSNGGDGSGDGDGDGDNGDGEDMEGLEEEFDDDEEEEDGAGSAGEAATAGSDEEAQDAAAGPAGAGAGVGAAVEEEEEEEEVRLLGVAAVERTAEDEDFEAEFLSLMTGSMDEARRQRGVATAGSGTGGRASAAVLNLERMPDSGAAALALARNREQDSRSAQGQRQGGAQGQRDGGVGASPQPQPGMRTFKLLQRGNRGRLETRTLAVPEGSALARVRGGAADARRAQDALSLKVRVLEYEAREREREMEQGGWRANGELTPWAEELNSSGRSGGSSRAQSHHTSDGGGGGALLGSDSEGGSPSSPPTFGGFLSAAAAGGGGSSGGRRGRGRGRGGRGRGRGRGGSRGLRGAAARSGGGGGGAGRNR